MFKMFTGRISNYVRYLRLLWAEATFSGYSFSEA